MNAFVIKMIALVCMLTDHLGAVFPAYFPFEFRIAGRVAFPLFVYMIAEGCRHTRSMPRYILRLGLFALISEIAFDLAFSHTRYSGAGISFVNDTNIFYTLCLGAVCVFIFQKLKEVSKNVPFRYAAVLLPALSVIPLLLIMRLAEVLETDYGAEGVLFVFLMYVIPKKIPRLCVMAAFLCYMYGAFLPAMVSDGWRFAPYLNKYDMGVLAGGLISVLFAALYNGKRGPAVKWFFYAAYPAHLGLFAGILHIL